MLHRSGASQSSYTSLTLTSSYVGQTPESEGLAAVQRRRAVAAAFAAAADPPSLVRP